MSTRSPCTVGIEPVQWACGRRQPKLARPLDKDGENRNPQGPRSRFSGTGSRQRDVQLTIAAEWLPRVPCSSVGLTCRRLT